MTVGRPAGGGGSHHGRRARYAERRTVSRGHADVDGGGMSSSKEARGAFITPPRVLDGLQESTKRVEYVSLDDWVTEKDKNPPKSRTW